MKFCKIMGETKFELGWARSSVELAMRESNPLVMSVTV